MREIKVSCKSLSPLPSPPPPMGAFVSSSDVVAPMPPPPQKSSSSIPSSPTPKAKLISSLPLPADLHRTIFLHLPRDELLFVLPLVCKSFNSLTNDDRLWQQVCSDILGRRSLPLVLMYAARELHASHEEDFGRKKATENDVPWKAVYVLLRRLSGPQFLRPRSREEDTFDLEEYIAGLKRRSFIHEPEKDVQVVHPKLSNQDACFLLRDLFITALASLPQLRMSLPAPPPAENVSQLRGRKDLPSLCISLPRFHWIEVFFYNLPIVPPKQPDPVDTKEGGDGDDDENNDNEKNNDQEEKEKNEEEENTNNANESPVPPAAAAGGGTSTVLPITLHHDQPLSPSHPRLCAVHYRPTTDGYSLVETDWSFSWCSKSVTYYHPSLASRLYQQGIGGVFASAVEVLVAANVPLFHGSECYLNSSLTPIAPLYYHRTNLVQEISKQVESSAKAALIALFGASAISESDPRKMKNAQLGRWLARLLDGVKGKEDDIDFPPSSKKPRKPKQVRRSHLPLVAFIRCIRRLCRVLIEQSLIQWVALISDFSLDKEGCNHNLTFELLDLYYSAQSIVPQLPVELTQRPYRQVRSRASELTLEEFPLHSLRRLRLLIEPVTVLIANFIHASAPLHPIAAVSLQVQSEKELILRSEEATASLLSIGLVNSSVYAVFEALLPREVQNSSGDEEEEW